MIEVLRSRSRVFAFGIISVVYILAAAAGLAVYRAVPGVWQVRLLIADAAATVIVFLFSVFFRNASVYDPYWSVQPPVILLFFASGVKLTPLRLLLLIAVFFWAVRLTANWAYTFHGLSHQDWRYTMLKEKTGSFYPIINFIGIHMVPTVIVYLCILPAVYAFLQNGTVNFGSAVFFLCAVGAAVLQGVADIQMHRFRSSKTGTFIRTGLWKYSRHPNYLGEILMWWSVALCVYCAFPGMWQLFIGAAANTVLFLAVSIPMAERRQSRKPGYYTYRKETRMLLPIKK